MRNIGFIGLGIMGSRMAANLQKAGYDLIVHNRTKEKADDLIKNGAIWANTAKEVAQNSDIIITMLSTPEVVKTIALGEYGLLQGAKENSLWINCSTVNPSFTKDMEITAKQHGIQYLDAPVAGTKDPAEVGELLFLVGGEKASVEEATPLLEIMGKKTLHLGEVGKGSAMKMLINQLLGQSMVAFAEAMVMGEAMGIEKETLFNVLLNTPVVAPVMAAVRPKLEHGNYEVNFPLQWIQKDLHLSSISAYENGVATPNLNTTKEVFAQARQQGFGEQDFTAVYEFLKPQK
ncbi:NAD(P)-dependent oxidoreductase [Aquimarina sp. MMG016]|uniref:NAD(P)-dependent oxidoreductase n=1 Tax=Aquimarina sp. MMG016 TaxID=2822690 RepID=UPI001B3A5A85|nr:NAD(P)-dependent oxidoreductase [Aquimarina sp. MMG016]MBQ4820846.1 NAD(P)-dependent oxidoreductase [Aquimarina sp. MMG016]